METAFSGLIVIGVMILSIVGLSERSFSTQAHLNEVSRLELERSGDRARTSLMPLTSASSPFGDSLSLTFKNAGATRLAQFDRWDVILQYTDGGGNYHVNWYASGTGWTPQIYQSVSPPMPERFDPGILNPGEILLIQVNLSPPAGAGTINLATVGTPSGITASTVFTR